MRVSAKSDYALRALIEMAGRTDSTPVSAEELGRRQEIPHGFLQAILADLRRSRVAMAALWLVSHPLRFSRVTRHDGVLSLRRGYTRREMNEMLVDAGVPAVARRRPGFRIVAAWETVSIQPSAFSSQLKADT